MTEPDPRQQYGPPPQWSQRSWPQQPQQQFPQPPQQEWQQYAQAQQYAYPAPQQDPYAQQNQWQQNQWQQPGFAPGHPAPQQAGAARKSAPTLLIVSLVVVLLAGGGVGAWLAFGGKGGTGAGSGGGSGLHAAWSQPGPATLPKADDTLGAWVSDGTVAVATDSAITAYALADGKPEWTWKPAAGTKICAVSPTVSGGIGAVASGSDSATCVDLQAVNVATGRSVWAHPASLVPKGGDQDSEFPAPFVSGGTAFAVDSGLYLDAFDLASGAPRWTSATAPKLSGNYCMVDGAAAIGSDVYAGMDCDNGAFLVGFAPVSGSVTSDIALPKACADDTRLKYTWAAGQDALVDCTDHDGADKTLDFLIVAPSSGKVSAVSLPSLKMDPFVGGSSQGSPYGFAISGDTLYVETWSGDNEGGTDEVLNALSLSTGAKQWSKPLVRDFVVVSADADGCLGLAYGPTGADGGDNLEAVRYTASSGAQSTLSSMNDDKEDYRGLARQPFVQLGTQLVVLGEAVDPEETFVSVLDGV